MRFCLVTTFYPPFNFGGDGLYVYRLANELAQRGHSVDVIHSVDACKTLTASGPQGTHPNHPGVHLFPLESRAPALSSLFTQQTGRPFFARELKRILSQDYDVIHFHNMSLIGITALTYGDAVKLYTLHEHWLVCPMHVLWRFDREPCAKQTCLRCTLAGKRPPQLWRYTRTLPESLAAVDVFIAPSRSTERNHRERGLMGPIVQLPHFVPEPRVTNAGEYPAQREPSFLFVGRLEKLKGVQTLIPLFRKHPEYRLLIAGDGNYREALRAMAGDASNIVFLGRREQGEIQQLYAGATATIVSSLGFEVFGLTVIESFALKTPVIANNLGALPELVLESGGGLIYNNDAELLASIERLATDRIYRDTLGEAGYETFLRKWTAEKHLEGYFAIIEDVSRRRRVAA